MAVFARRTLQRLIYENAKFLSEEQLKWHVELLNNQSNQESPLAVEWEIACLNAFSKIGAIVHEPEMGKRPDLFIPDTGEGKPFIADIRTISDKGYNRESPVISFQEKIKQEISAFGLNGNHFSFAIGGENKGSFRDFKRILKIPSDFNKRKGIYAEIINFLTKIKENPGYPRSFKKDDNSINMQIKYDSSQKFQTWTWPAYTIAYSLKRNPLYQALHDKKKQVKNAEFVGPRGIIICDGGCEILRRTSKSFDEYSVSDIIRAFFRGSSSISIVTIVTVSEKILCLFGRGTLKIQMLSIQSTIGYGICWIKRSRVSHVPSIRHIGLFHEGNITRGSRFTAEGTGRCPK